MILKVIVILFLFYIFSREMFKELERKNIKLKKELDYYRNKK